MLFTTIIALYGWQINVEFLLVASLDRQLSVKRNLKLLSFDVSFHTSVKCQADSLTGLAMNERQRGRELGFC